MCKLPYGISDYGILKTEKYIYIDKSMYIEQLENDKRYVHFLRPRRFGKSLFTSMLGYYYDIASKDKFDQLFQDTYIHKHPTKERNSYYILNFNFSGLSNKKGAELEQEFAKKVSEAISECIQHYSLPVNVITGMSPARILSDFISKMTHLLNDIQFYVIIDEYDHFANDLLSFRFQEFTDIMGSEGYVRAFYEELKNGTQKGIGRIFVTGVSPISLDSMTSGLGAAHPWCNISTNLSLNPRFHDMMGFTSEEVKGLIEKVEHISDQEQTLLTLKQYYDGYRFSKRAKHHTFNPNMVLYYLSEVQTNGYEPEDIVDRNIYSDYDKLKQLLQINDNLNLKENVKENHKNNVQRILDGEHPSVVITTQFTLTTRFNDQDFFSLLFYLGYLTIDQADNYTLTMKIPNVVMKKVFVEYFQRMLEETLNFRADISGWQQAIATFITKNDPTVYIQEIESILHRYSDRLFINFKEKNIQQIGEMIVGAIEGVDSDLEDENDQGYSDHIILPIDPQAHRKLIEYKYLKVNYTQAELQKAITEAHAEIEKYTSSRQLQRYHYDAWIMVFSKDTCVYKECVEI